MPGCRAGKMTLLFRSENGMDLLLKWRGCENILRVKMVRSGRTAVEKQKLQIAP